MAKQNYKKLITQAQELIDQTQASGTPADAAVDKCFLLSKQLYQQGEVRVSRQLLVKARELLKQQGEACLAKTPLDETETLGLTKRLKNVDEHALARQLLHKLLAQGCSDELTIKATQQLALNTYKDSELPPDERHSQALTILEGIGLRSPDCKDPETLGQAGAIYKRKFDRSGRLEDLQAAHYFYQRGWTLNPEQDMGYCGINAAFILDKLAHRAHVNAAREKIPATECESLSKQANDLRKQLLAELPNYATVQDQDILNQWWFLVSMAEAAFGLEQWDAAGKWLEQAKTAEHFEWERQTTTRQLVAIARMQGFVPPEDGQSAKDWAPPWQVLSLLLGADAPACFECFRGKVGLALSGGGFRASLYHLGVLARLAEVDALRSVEVLSTVSGGSIVGAHYYLALRKLLMEKTDAEISRDDYIQLVREVIAQFFNGVSENLRVRALASLPDNFKMLFQSGYGRSNRMGELYETYFYQQVEAYQAAADGVANMRPMHDLRIHPLTADPLGNTTFTDQSFHPQHANWRRRSKVPTLLLNTTSLNSGHNWHFTASFMGEPPGLTGQDIDMNQRYRRLYYWQAPTEKLKHYPLGYAVAASAGVPALFDPLELNDLYPDRTIRLVDGGVHDNQGVAGLLDECCDLILCSDASGQMDDQASPKKSALSVFFRSDSILQDRVREAQYQDLEAKAKNNALQGLFFIHLKLDLHADPLDWIQCDNPTPEPQRPHCTDYGIDRSQQRRLAQIRTDLDTFTEVEAYALMASGYAMTKHQLSELDRQHQSLQLNGHWADFDIHAPEQNWPFSSIAPILTADPEAGDPKAKDLAKQLSASSLMAGKALVLIPTLKYAGMACGLLLLALLIDWIKQNWLDHTTITLGVASITTALIITLVGVLLPFGKYLQPLDTARKWIGLAVLGSVGWALANLHLKFFDQWFKKRGKLQRLLNL
ncbi:MAG: patatin-like phospholipase family protein [Methylomonas sp.]|jgi:predicted acylesterase/phospholipase RssA|uniref:patatin-like phospholipase family protein n=1 Tax=Methylomonas sp. TaxID=418 RepID=UPI0025F22971|nr:patatin-like phospholipase family protein [Methylomonas sp.]MCK9605888.1 patatin-like phospholipase family protein [Methylomonas sp.]